MGTGRLGRVGSQQRDQTPPARVPAGWGPGVEAQLPRSAGGAQAPGVLVLHIQPPRFPRKNAVSGFRGTWWVQGARTTPGLHFRPDALAAGLSEGGGQTRSVSPNLAGVHFQLGLGRGREAQAVCIQSGGNSHPSLAPLILKRVSKAGFTGREMRGGLRGGTTAMPSSLLPGPRAGETIWAGW